MKRTIKIGNMSVGLDYPPCIIAEMSGNHNQSLDRALEIVEAAKEAGVHALKLQTYTADTLTIDSENEPFFISDSNSPWKGQSLYKLFQQAYTPWEWHETIFKRCSELGMIAFSTPFDETAVDFLESLNVPAYKIASFENNHIPLIRKVASTGKPVIVSTGMATIAELDEIVRTIHDAGGNEIALLKCTSAYPSTPVDANLITIPHLRQLFDTEVGLSDHTLGIGVSIAAVAMGATLIEKHFTLSRVDGGVDSAFSMEPDEIQLLVKETVKAWQALGEISYGTTENERTSVKFRRSVYIVEDVKVGDKLTSKNIRVVRPGNGLSPKYYDLLLGRKVSCNLRKGTPMSWDFVL
ncbi:MAG: Pseudaminic acid synthase [Candidatus Scalindua arabica]|uniref:Pseudaminic acid synthase n=1 Tax=Candidatus Scalindua arabica TaxID=1127984 RepID=A0A942A0N3_9BACT|nr:Pseudaminic acid synthase [Candidatus Scalindua arabica]